MSLACAVSRAPRAEDPAAAKLRAKISELETSLAATGAPARPSSASPLPPVSTREAADLGSKAKQGEGNRQEVQLLLQLTGKEADRELCLEVEKLLVSGASGYPTLLDFCLALDADTQKVSILLGKYQVSFGLANLVLRHEVETAKFAHYALAATRAADRIFTRSVIYDFLTVFLRFHKGRFPDLEHDLEKDLLSRIETSSKQDLPPILVAAATLGVRLKPEFLEQALWTAKDQGEAMPVIEHLVARDDAESVRILTRVLNRQKHFKEWKATAMLVTLARMTAPEAQRALSIMLSTADRQLKEAATLAYFSFPKTASSAPLAAEYLNSPAELREKKILIHRLRQSGREVLDALKAQPERILDLEVRELVLNEGLPAKPTARTKAAKKD